MNGRMETLVENLDLPPGYYAEGGESGVYLMDPDGRRVMWLPGDVILADPRGGERPDSSAKPVAIGWQELCHSLLVQLSRQIAECERLRYRVAELDEQLEAAETERDQANAIAEDLYEFFRRRVREVLASKEGSGKGNAD